jgi:hypothetical protein
MKSDFFKKRLNREVLSKNKNQFSIPKSLCLDLCHL